MMHNEFILEERIACFSMEIALRNEMPPYAGGLGVLARDTVRKGADLELPLVAVSLVSRAGYFRQEIDAQGRQMEHQDPWDPGRFASPLDAKIEVSIEGREVWVRSWLYVMGWLPLPKMASTCQSGVGYNHLNEKGRPSHYNMLD